jgi:hypothetical protein
VKNDNKSSAIEETYSMKNFTADNSAWADFLISKAALILASIVLFAALFQLVADFKDFETQKQMDSLAWDFKNAVDKVGTANFQEVVSKGSPDESHGESSNESSDNSSDKSSEEFKEISYCFNDKEVFCTLPFEEDLKIRVSGEYVGLEAVSDGKNFSAVRPFTFRILPFNRSVLQDRLHTRFGADGTAASPLTEDYTEIEAFVSMLGTEESVFDPEVNISLKKELIYVKEDEGVSAFACILIYQ